MKSATIVGAGLVGSLWAVHLSKAGYKVTILEMRSDLRNVDIAAGKSINLAFSERGWTAFKAVGIDSHVNDIAIPMYGRTIHDTKGNLTYQPYGQEGQAIYSVSRAGINCKLMNIAENIGAENIQILFNEKCIGADLKNGIVHTENTKTGIKSKFESNIVFATDGAFSAIRYRAMQKVDRFEYNQHYIEDGYREILLPANEDGSYKLEKNSLHIWPRGRFMLIALPNEDGSFTCTLFMPFENHEFSFDKLKSKNDVEHFFKEVFSDFYNLMPNIAEVWQDHPLSSLAIIKCYPWAHGKTVLMGDAAHATVPFYGQGMNSGFEDCTIMGQLMDKHDENWELIFDEYQKMRKPEGDAVQDLSLHNYYVMRDYVSDPKFLLQKKFERRIEQLFPGKYTPLYTQVSFTNIPYTEALENGKQQDTYIKGIMEQHDIEKLFSTDKIDALINSLFL
ncbi:MAG: NAD(P)/FAD-dependent oxidoreductase [Saprospiraceae bacterium]